PTATKPSPNSCRMRCARRRCSSAGGRCSRNRTRWTRRWARPIRRPRSKAGARTCRSTSPPPPPCPARSCATACACWPVRAGNCATCAEPATAMAARIPVLLAWSGGKDAAWALHLLRQSATHQVVGLLSTVAAGRASMQGVRVEILRAQADATGLPLLEMEVAPGCDNATYLHALAASLDQAASRWPGLRTAAFGDLLLEDLRAWRREQLDSLGWALLTPLFRFDTAMLARRMVDSGVRASLCCVDTRQLD